MFMQVDIRRHWMFLTMRMPIFEGQKLLNWISTSLGDHPEGLDEDILHAEWWRLTHSSSFLLQLFPLWLSTWMIVSACMPMQFCLEVSLSEFNGNYSLPSVYSRVTQTPRGEFPISAVSLWKPEVLGFLFVCFFLFRHLQNWLQASEKVLFPPSLFPPWQQHNSGDRDKGQG